MRAAFLILLSWMLPAQLPGFTLAVTAVRRLGAKAMCRIPMLSFPGVLVLSAALLSFVGVAPAAYHEGQTEAEVSSLFEAVRSEQELSLERRLDSAARIASLVANHMYCKTGEVSGPPCSVLETNVEKVAALKQWASKSEGWERTLASLSLFHVGRTFWYQENYDRSLLAVEQSIALKLFPYQNADLLESWQRSLVHPKSGYTRQRQELANALVLQADCLLEMGQGDRSVAQLEKAMQALQLAAALVHNSKVGRNDVESTEDTMTQMTVMALQIASAAVDVLNRLRISHIHELMDTHGVTCQGCTDKASLLRQLVPRLNLPVVMLSDSSPHISPLEDPLAQDMLPTLKGTKETQQQYTKRQFRSLLGMVHNHLLEELQVDCARRTAEGFCASYLPPWTWDTTGGVAAPPSDALHDGPYYASGSDQPNLHSLSDANNSRRSRPKLPACQSGSLPCIPDPTNPTIPPRSPTANPSEADSVHLDGVNTIIFTSTPPPSKPSPISASKGSQMQGVPGGAQAPESAGVDASGGRHFASGNFHDAVRETLDRQLQEQLAKKTDATTQHDDPLVLVTLLACICACLGLYLYIKHRRRFSRFLQSHWSAWLTNPSTERTAGAAATPGVMGPNPTPSPTSQSAPMIQSRKAAAALLRDALAAGDVSKVQAALEAAAGVGLEPSSSLLQRAQAMVQQRRKRDKRQQGNQNKPVNSKKEQRKRYPLGRNSSLGGSKDSVASSEDGGSSSSLALTGNTKQESPTRWRWWSFSSPQAENQADTLQALSTAASTTSPGPALPVPSVTAQSSPSPQRPPDRALQNPSHPPPDPPLGIPNKAPLHCPPDPPKQPPSHPPPDPPHQPAPRPATPAAGQQGKSRVPSSKRPPSAQSSEAESEPSETPPLHHEVDQGDIHWPPSGKKAKHKAPEVKALPRRSLTAANKPSSAPNTTTAATSLSPHPQPPTAPQPKTSTSSLESLPSSRTSTSAKPALPPSGPPARPCSPPDVFPPSMPIPTPVTPSPQVSPNPSWLSWLSTGASPAPVSTESAKQPNFNPHNAGTAPSLQLPPFFHGSNSDITAFTSVGVASSTDPSSAGAKKHSSATATNPSLAAFINLNITPTKTPSTASLPDLDTTSSTAPNFPAPIGANKLLPTSAPKSTLPLSLTHKPSPSTSTSHTLVASSKVFVPAKESNQCAPPCQPSNNISSAAMSASTSPAPTLAPILPSSSIFSSSNSTCTATSASVPLPEPSHSSSTATSATRPVLYSQVVSKLNQSNVTTLQNPLGAVQHPIPTSTNTSSFPANLPTSVPSVPPSVHASSSLVSTIPSSNPAIALSTSSQVYLTPGPTTHVPRPAQAARTVPANPFKSSFQPPDGQWTPTQLLPLNINQHHLPSKQFVLRDSQALSGPGLPEGEKFAHDVLSPVHTNIPGGRDPTRLLLPSETLLPGLAGSAAVTVPTIAVGSSTFQGLGDHAFQTGHCAAAPTREATLAYPDPGALSWTDPVVPSEAVSVLGASLWDPMISFDVSGGNQADVWTSRSKRLQEWLQVDTGAAARASAIAPIGPQSANVPSPGGEEDVFGASPPDSLGDANEWIHDLLKHVME